MENNTPFLNNKNPNKKPPFTFLWRNRLRPDETKGIPEIFQGVLNKAKETLREFRTENKEINRVAVVISAYDAQHLLPGTLKELIEQLRELTFTGEIFVVLNNGGGNTKDFISPDLKQQQIENIAKKIGVDEIIFGRTKNLTKSVSNSRSIPREITLDKDIAQKGGLRLVIIDQQNEPDNAGKIRGLRDIYEFLRKKNKEIGYCPEYLFAIDSETRLRHIDRRSKKIIIDENRGLSHLINLLKEGRRMVGAKLQFVPYTNGDPDWSKKTPPMQEAISILHGMKGFEWLPGGATLGSFPEMVSILNAISTMLPGTRIEDVLTTVVAKELGIETIIDDEVIHANKCPHMTEKQEVSAQIERWLKGNEGLKRITGESLAEKVIDNNIFRIIFGPLSQMTRGEKVNIPHLLLGLLPYLRVNRLAKKHPDDFIDGESTFTSLS